MISELSVTSCHQDLHPISYQRTGSCRHISRMWKYVGWLNVFVYCKFLKLLGHIMVLLVLSIVCFTWYAVVPATYGPMMVTGAPGARFGGSLLVLLFSWLVSGAGALIRLHACSLQLCLCQPQPVSTATTFPACCSQMRYGHVHVAGGLAGDHVCRLKHNVFLP